ncbi:radical SAM protein [Candidatus Omnitrophota bacterium]
MIRKKIEGNERISDHEALWLLTRGDLMFMGEMANLRRKEMVGNNAFYQYNYNINHTNICENECDLCAFYRDENEGYVLTLEEIEEAVRKVHEVGVNEVHIVGGLNEQLKLDYFVSMLMRIKAIDPHIHIQAFTTVEIAYFAKQSGTTTRQILTVLRDAGLDTLPGGGAEIFSERVRNLICKNKISGAEWLRIMEEAHELGIQSNATMLYGHIETAEEIVDHLSRLRALQDRTGGFFAFVPLAFFPDNTKINGMRKETFGDLDMKILACARMYLDNFDHLKSMWMIYGYKACQVGLDFGADDIGGTYFDEIIVHAAGATTPKSLTKDEICALITKMNRVPVQVNSKYQLINEEVTAL